MTHERNGRRYVANLGLAIFGLGAAVVLAEAALHVLDLYPPDPYWRVGEKPAVSAPRVDSLVGWTLGSNRVVPTDNDEFSVTYRADSLGFRRGPDGVPAPARVGLLFLGDSFTFGNGVEWDSTFAARTGAALSMEVRNLGMSGFGVDQMWQTLRHYAGDLQPRVTVLAYIDDDLRRSLRAYRQREEWWEKPTYRLEDDTLVRQRPEDLPPGWISFLRNRLRLAELWREAEWKSAIRYATGGAWDLNEAIFLALRDDVERSGAHLLVVRIPQRLQTEGSPITRALAEHGIDVLDLAEYLPDDPAPLYFGVNPHLNDRGHAWAAAQIIARLRSEAIHAAPDDGESPSP